ncbi:MAG TPA: phosphotransferase [Microlunatus sp.]|nr:phosphotransferase [Microlunatus sp.]
MITDGRPEMLWERTDARVELQRRFGFASAAAAATWVTRVLSEDYALRVTSLERLVISAYNLMVWVTTREAGRLMIKVCRLTAAHDSLSARGALVRWLADRGLPVAAPLSNLSGDHQGLRDGRSLGVQPVLPGELLDADDLGQVRAAGEMLASLHVHLADWPQAGLLEHVRPVAGGGSGGHPAAPAELRSRLEQRARDLPELPHQPVHADYRGANVLTRGQEITGVVDFEEARLDSAAVDVAHAVCLLGTWYHDWRPMTPQAQSEFLDSYTGRRPLTAAEQTCLPPLIARGMLGLGWWDDARRWLE